MNSLHGKGACRRNNWFINCKTGINPLNAELNPNRHLLALVGACHIVHVSKVRVNLCISYKCKLVNRQVMY
jgi:hypothetical protein